jgi:hypothetical protein
MYTNTLGIFILFILWDIINGDIINRTVTDAVNATQSVDESIQIKYHFERLINSDYAFKNGDHNNHPTRRIASLFGAF